MGHPVGAVLKPLVKIGKRADDCWEWLGVVNTNGQPQKQFNGAQLPARRWMWSQLFGPIPDGLIVTNTCGKLTCCNPAHLRCCFQADAVRCGPSTVLLPADVAEIRAAGKTKSANTAALLAERYGVTPSTIRDVWKRRSWNRPKPNYGPKSNGKAAPAGGAL